MKRNTLETWHECICADAIEYSTERPYAAIREALCRPLLQSQPVALAVGITVRGSVSQQEQHVVAVSRDGRLRRGWRSEPDDAIVVRYNHLAEQQERHRIYGGVGRAFEGRQIASLNWEEPNFDEATFDEDRLKKVKSEDL